ncbi:hypothetical protein T440DRAFT_469229 [Plenodomus tracheiphilus IPT5]|uniref:Mitochondrial intermembrane space import and assembly protein 40 n=1 Tax=Plenodomus tracheiphilus IPT5 TaxID=1408161 RepID=A0A6A7B245_9PLEO|nr:hypothetical protein T440DRAFT_469229 [Plenodomus tracheiphilus IPT5]
MFRAAPRLIARPAARAAPFRSIAPARRCLSTAPPTQKSRSWKSLVARFGIAGGILYYYNTVDVFAEEPRHALQSLPETDTESEHLPTIESISEERKRRHAVQAQLEAQQQKEAASAQQNAKASSGEGGIEGLEEEADQQGAFNPETGEINWDCPCLGGMATGPCGEEFKAAFSCFVYSEEEPKGMDCIDKFKGMQDCFRQYPEIYGSEIDPDDADEEDDLAADLAASESAPGSSNTNTASLSASDMSSDAQSAPFSSQPRKLSGEKPRSGPHSPEKLEANRRELGLVPENYQPDAMTEATGDKGTEEMATTRTSESERVVPKAAFDAGDEGTRTLERK